MTEWTALDWRQALVELEARSEPHVLVTVLEALGSTPRAAGTKMVVAARGQAGTIGGGALENDALETARRLLTEGAAAPVTEKLTLKTDLDQCCGGVVTLLYEPMQPPALRLALFGAGHVARALVRALDGTEVAVLCIDERPEALADPLPGRAATRIARDPAAEVAALAAGTHVRIMTHSHDRDLEIVAAALRRDDLGSVGLIGSKTKWACFRSQLPKEGIPAEKIASVLCPVGIPGVGGKRPAEIAIAIAAELLQRR